MQVFFESRAPEGAQMRELAIRRLRFVMRRLTWMVPRARVRLSDTNGPRGGVDKQVHIELNTDMVGTVVIKSVARDWRAALDDALTRAARVLLRSWRRESQLKRPHALALNLGRPRPYPVDSL